MRRAALAASGLCAGLLLAEALSRVLAPAAVGAVRLNRYLESERGKFCRPHPELGWEGVPSASGELVWPDSRSRVAQNALGLRGPETPFERSAKRRVLVLGDSFAWGFGVSEGKLFTDILARREGVEVVNLGVSGYGTDQEYLQWRRLGRRWKPDEVWLLVDPATDLADVGADSRHGHAKPRFAFDAKGRYRLLGLPVPAEPFRRERSDYAVPAPSAPVRFLLARSDLFCLALAAAARAPALREALERRAWIPGMRAGYDWEPPLYLDPPDPALSPLWTAFSGILSLLSDDVRREGARLVVVAVPSPVQVYPRLWSRMLERAPAPPAGARYDAQAPSRILAAVAAGVGAGFIDLAPGLSERARRGPDLYFPINLHWTEAGHRAAADLLAPLLR